MTNRRSLLVFGGTGQTGQHFTRLALDAGHRLRVLARTPAKVTIQHDDLEVVQGALDDVRANTDLRVVPLCPFVVDFVEDHVDYRELLDR